MDNKDPIKICFKLTTAALYDILGFFIIPLTLDSMLSAGVSIQFDTAGTADSDDYSRTTIL